MHKATAVRLQVFPPQNGDLLNTPAKPPAGDSQAAARRPGLKEQMKQGGIAVARSRCTGMEDGADGLLGCMLSFRIMFPTRGSSAPR